MEAGALACCLLPACLCYFGVWLLIYGDFIEQISGQDKLAQNNFNGVVPVPNSTNRQRPSHPVPINNLEIPNHSMRLSAPSRVSAYPANDSLAPPGVTNLSNGYGSNSNGNSNDSDRRLFGSAVNAISRSRSRWYDTSNPMPYTH
ncbi:hypothetical protein NC652_041195 [Populus alba x Populus x berolinensis]|nr:hypothetical protein NC652_041195 [Populus alba x Populus x berolinensis]